MTSPALTRTNQELLDAARHGDEDALAALVERHRGGLERLVRLRMDRPLQGRVDPADVVQEAYLAVCRKIPRYSAEREAGPRTVHVRHSRSRHPTFKPRKHGGHHLEHPRLPSL